jgi:hypothetical protein
MTGNLVVSSLMASAIAVMAVMGGTGHNRGHTLEARQIPLQQSLQ